MRRKDREMGKDFALNVIDESEFGILGICSEASVYTIPLSIVRNGETLYFHSAKLGKKTEMFADGKKVSISFVSKAKVPKILSYAEIKQKIQENNFLEIGAKVFTTEFESAHVDGKIYEVKNEQEIIDALMLISKKYAPEFLDFAEVFIKQSLDRIAVYKIEIEEISGKRKKFDKDGEEMKFQREEQ